MVFTILFDDGGKANLVGHPQRMRKEESGEGAGEQGYKYAVRMSLSFFRQCTVCRCTRYTSLSPFTHDAWSPHVQCPGPQS